MKIVTAEEAINKIRDNANVGLGTSSVTWTVPESLLEALGKVYHVKKHPSNVSLYMGVSPGTFTEEDYGTNHLVEEGLIGKVISAHVSAGRKFEQCIANNQFPTFTVPLGVYNNLLKTAISNGIGYLTRIGLNTYADPRQEGCKVNPKAYELDDIVELVKIQNQEMLFYKTFKLDTCILKASCVDKEGNISFNNEPIIGDQVDLALATHNQGGIVIVEVEKVVKKLNPKDVAIHKSLVDYVVISKISNRHDKKKRSLVAKGSKRKKELIPLDSRKICGRRASLELEENSIVNLGVGMPEYVSKVAFEENIINDVTLSVEMGPLGGTPLGGKYFGASVKPEAIMSIAQTMDLYNGGFLSLSILGLAEMDQQGNVNVSKYNNRITGPGGFIDISQATKKIIFLGTFTSGNLKEQVEDNQLKIISEGKIKKLKKEVKQITFSATEALKNKQEVMYITERAVFKLTEEGVVLTEIAPGIDLKRDVIDQMEFVPIIPEHLKIMDSKIFVQKLMNLNLKKNNNKRTYSVIAKDIIRNVRETYKYFY